MLDIRRRQFFHHGCGFRPQVGVHNMSVTVSSRLRHGRLYDANGVAARPVTRFEGATPARAGAPDADRDVGATRCAAGDRPFLAASSEHSGIAHCMQIGRAPFLERQFQASLRIRRL